MAIQPTHSRYSEFSGLFPYISTLNQLPFIPNRVYNRRQDIHGPYGGNWQSGISVSSSFPYIFIFTGSTGHQHGYRDGWDNPNIFTYTGEGQVGDMQFTRGNLALRDHLSNGTRVFLFEQLGKGLVKFAAEVEFYDVGFVEAHDRLGNNRNAIKFFFKRVGAFIPVQPYQLNELATVTAEDPFNTVQKRFVNTRVGQGAYRKRILHRWEYSCAVTKFDNLSVLVASHIVPWSTSNDQERLDVHNGILLSPDYDALFDRNLISFENSGKIILSDKIEATAFNRIGITGKEAITNLSEHNFYYLEQHRERMV